ncbi:FRAS1-related extracellular matrix protein 1-like [Acanthochromis polyacanthus]|uniref:FRAS1-related extracellular matrix protein 1-like n=1 Tax=Acanthochromis polyacanthus TaxID=80966 RepID=UPI0022346A79|nr:FRAS1-related extracellular matrix protein 1-like [Acanthochromis polyacanthus]
MGSPGVMKLQVVTHLDRKVNRLFQRLFLDRNRVSEVLPADQLIFSELQQQKFTKLSSWVSEEEGAVEEADSSPRTGGTGPGAAVTIRTDQPDGRHDDAHHRQQRHKQEAADRRKMLSVVSLLLLLLSASCSSTLVVVNSGVEVTRGRWVFVRQTELQISVDPTSDCKVEVVMNEPVTQRVGRLTPQVFDCSFLEDEVKYVHNGSPLLDEDTVKLRVYRFTSSDTLVQTVVLKVQVLDSDSGLVELGSVPLVVPQFYGLSNAINGSVLNIRTSGLICSVRLMNTDVSVPAVGQLVREEESSQRTGRQTAALCPGNKPCLHHTKQLDFLKTSCTDFLSSGLKVPAPQSSISRDRLHPHQGGAEAAGYQGPAGARSEAVWLPVLIHGAMQNQPPHAAFMASFILEVDQFILTPLTTAALDADDHETPREKLVFNVTEPPADRLQSLTWTTTPGRSSPSPGQTSTT